MPVRTLVWAGLTLGFLATAVPASADTAPWCMRFGSDNHGIHCIYTSRTHCEAARIANGYCERNPQSSETAASPPTRRR